LLRGWRWVSCFYDGGDCSVSGECFYLVFTHALLFPGFVSFFPFWFTDLLCFGGCGYVLVLWWLPEVLVVQWWSCSGVHWIVCVLSWRTCGMVMVLAVWILWCGEVVSWGQRVPAVVVSPWCEEVLGVGFVVLGFCLCAVTF
jgi:hypothetical protein